jgi:hypothetical protein
MAAPIFARKAAAARCAVNNAFLSVVSRNLERRRVSVTEKKCYATSRGHGNSDGHKYCRCEGPWSSCDYNFCSTFLRYSFYSFNWIVYTLILISIFLLETFVIKQPHWLEKWHTSANKKWRWCTGKYDVGSTGAGSAASGACPASS